MEILTVVGPTKERPYHLYGEERVTPGWPHGDAWGALHGFPETYDTKRHRKKLEELAKKKGNKQ